MVGEVEYLYAFERGGQVVLRSGSDIPAEIIAVSGCWFLVVSLPRAGRKEGKRSRDVEEGVIKWHL